MVAEYPVGQHLAFSIDGIDMLHGRADLLYTGAGYGVQDCLMYAGKDYIVIPSQLLCQDRLYSRVEERDCSMEAGGSGEQVTLLALPVVPGADPGLASLLLR